MNGITGAIVGAIFGAAAGGKVGYNLERSDKFTRSLGLDKVSYRHYKIGRFWESQSTWNDIKGKRYVIKTFKNTNNTGSYYNGALLCKHGTSASSINISK